MTSRKIKRKKTGGSTPVDRIKSRLGKGSPYAKLKFRSNQTASEKISDVVLRFVEPYTHDLESKGEWKSLIELAFIAWNVSLLPPEERKDLLNESFEESNLSLTEGTKEVIDQMILRKEKFFSDYGQLLAAYDLTMINGYPNLTVAFLREE